MVCFGCLVNLCGCGFGLFASYCGFFFLCVCVRSVCVSGGILPVEAGSCLQSGSQQSPDL